MCNSPHLEAVLMHIKRVSPHCKFLFDGDCMQLSMKVTPGYPGIPFLTRDRFQEVCPNTQIICFEKCMTYRIQNAVKLAHMGKMRLGIAEQDTLDYLKKAKIPKEQHPVLRVFANACPAAEFNEKQLNLFLRSSKSKSLTVLQAKDFWTDSKVATKMSANEEQSLSVEADIKVVQGAPILIVQNHLAEKCFGQQQGQKLHIGNGTTGIFREYELATDSIIVDVQLSDKREYVRIKRWNFCTETKTRSQFPIMLAWAASIQKVQGMEFKFLEVDFCLNYYATPSSGHSDFFQGCAYMVFTRAETVAVIGDITLPLLNNVNSWCLQWWKSQVSSWNDFKKRHLTQKPVFRNAIHQHNWHASQLQKIANDRIQAASVPALLAPTPPHALLPQNESQAAFATTRPAAVATPANQLKPDSAKRLADAPNSDAIRSANVAPAPVPAAVSAPASTPAPASVKCVSSIIGRESDDDYELIVTNTPGVEADRDAAPAPAPELFRAPAPVTPAAKGKKRVREGDVRVAASTPAPVLAPTAYALVSKAAADQVDTANTAAKKGRKILPKIEKVAAILEVTAVVVVAAAAAIVAADVSYYAIKTKPSLRRVATIKLLQNQSC
jgi:hypothetical protein